MGSPGVSASMYSPSYGYHGAGGGGVAVYRGYQHQQYYSPQSYTYRTSDFSSNYGSSYSSSSYSSPMSPYLSSRRTTSAPSRGMSMSPGPSSLSSSSFSSSRAARHRTVMRFGQDDEENRNTRLKSPSIPRETTRDELIDSIVHTRTREHRPLPGFKSASDYDERRHLRIDCDKVFDGIIIGNGDTICNINYLKGIGVTHVLNTAERHVEVNPGKYPCYGIKYYGFHVDDLPEANISRYFPTTTSFIDSAVSGGGLVVVNCVMGWSRSASVVAAYLVMKHKMKASRALELIRQNRNIQPNAGFLQQLADLENRCRRENIGNDERHRHCKTHNLVIL